MAVVFVRMDSTIVRPCNVIAMWGRWLLVEELLLLGLQRLHVRRWEVS